MAALIIRPAATSDSERIIEIVGACFGLYPGCVLDLPNLDKELPIFAEYFADNGGEAFVAAQGDCVVGCIAWTPHDDGGIELKRLYVDPNAHGTGTGAALTEKVMDAARRINARYIDLWSDTRFTRAHAFYERFGWIKQPETRDLNDPSNTTEYYFRLERRP